MRELSQRHPKNCPGPFYVLGDECMSCGAPELEADGLMDHDENGQCYFARQPTTADETNAAILAVCASCCGAVRYGGNDPEVLLRLAALGLAEQSDLGAPSGIRPVVRNYARFRFAGDASAAVARESERIIEALAAPMRPVRDSVCSIPEYSRDEASFTYTWGWIIEKNGLTVTISIRRERSQEWLVWVAGHEPAHTSFAIWLDRTMRANAAFESIRWFSGRELAESGETGQSHPY